MLTQFSKPKLIAKCAKYIILANLLATTSNFALANNISTAASREQSVSNAAPLLNAASPNTKEIVANTASIHTRVGESSTTWTPSDEVLKTNAGLEVAKKNLQLATDNVAAAKEKVKIAKRSGGDVLAAEAELAKSKSAEKIARINLKDQKENARKVYEKEKQERKEIDEARKKAQQNN